MFPLLIKRVDSRVSRWNNKFLHFTQLQYFDASLWSLASHASSFLSPYWLHMLSCALDCQWNVCNAVRKRSSVWLSVCVYEELGCQVYCWLWSAAAADSSPAAKPPFFYPAWHCHSHSASAVKRACRHGIMGRQYFRPKFWGIIMCALHAESETCRTRAKQGRWFITVQRH